MKEFILDQIKYEEYRKLKITGVMFLTGLITFFVCCHSLFNVQILPIKFAAILGGITMGHHCYISLEAYMKSYQILQAIKSGNFEFNTEGGINGSFRNRKS